MPAYIEQGNTKMLKSKFIAFRLQGLTVRVNHLSLLDGSPGFACFDEAHLSKDNMLGGEFRA